jgi:glycosyltransferase involved in cell wall biosynthesis
VCSSDLTLNFHFVGTFRNSYILSTASYALNAVRFLFSDLSRYDIVIEDFAPYNPVFSFCRRKNAVIQLHQKEGLHHIKRHPFGGIFFMLIEAVYPKFFRNAIAVSAALKGKFGIGAAGAVIPNGFEPALLAGEAAESGYVLFLGRLHINQKGLDMLLDSLKHIAKKFKLVIAGGGKDEAGVRKMFGACINSGEVDFAGFVRDERKEALLKNCSFMVFPSRYEGQPLTLLEAAACGKPVIVSDIPELKCAVDAGFGISFRTGSADDLGGKINFLLENDALRKEMGRKAREYAKNFSWDKIALDYERFLIKVAGGQNS